MTALLFKELTLIQKSRISVRFLKGLSLHCKLANTRGKAASLLLVTKYQAFVTNDGNVLRYSAKQGKILNKKLCSKWF